MKRLVCTIYDVATRVYVHPLACVASVAQLKREMTEYVNQDNKQTPPQQYPEDFEVYRLGEFDDESGVLVPIAPPERLFRLSDLKSKS